MHALKHIRRDVEVFVRRCQYRWPRRSWFGHSTLASNTSLSVAEAVEHAVDKAAIDRSSKRLIAIVVKIPMSRSLFEAPKL